MFQNHYSIQRLCKPFRAVKFLILTLCFSGLLYKFWLFSDSLGESSPLRSMTQHVIKDNCCLELVPNYDAALFVSLQGSRLYLTFESAYFEYLSLSFPQIETPALSCLESPARVLMSVCLTITPAFVSPKCLHIFFLLSNLNKLQPAIK